MDGSDRRGHAPGGLGLGLVGLLPANRQVSFRAIHPPQRGAGLGLAADASHSSLTALLRRPAATPGREGLGEPNPIPSEQSQGPQGLSHRDEGNQEKPASPRFRPVNAKRPRSSIEILGQARMKHSIFGNLERATADQPFELPPAAPHEEPSDPQGPSVWAPLEFESGFRLRPEGESHFPGFSTVLQLATNTASRAKEKCSSFVNRWSPKRNRPLDPPINDRLPLQPEGSRDKNKRRKSNNILAIARRASLSRKSTKDLEKDFAANSSRKAKKAIRETILKVFKEAEGTEPMPPSVDKVKLLGGILKAAKYKAAGNYLGEYKLMAVEGGFSWSEQLERTLKLSKRSAARASGPKAKAVEVNTQETGETFAVRISDKTPKKVPLAGELFDFGVIWMMREIELAAVTKDHIALDFTVKRVKLTIPVSKMDQEAAEVKRVLQCVCEQKTCDISCPFHVSARLLDRMAALNCTQAGVTHQKKMATKAQIVADWQRLYGDKVSGHSARRSGALRYIRRGWAIPQVAYLGRWKSAVIYEYAAEALESLPVNTGGAFQQSAGASAAPAQIHKGPSFEEFEHQELLACGARVGEGGSEKSHVSTGR